MKYIIDNKEIHEGYTTKVHNIAKRRLRELTDQRYDCKVETQEVVVKMGTLIGIEVFSDV